MAWEKGRKRKRLATRCTLRVFNHLFDVHLQQVKEAKSFSGQQPVSLKELAETFCYATPEITKTYKFLKTFEDIPKDGNKAVYEYHRFCAELAKMRKAGILERPNHGQFMINKKMFASIAAKCKGNKELIPADFFDGLLEKAGL